MVGASVPQFDMLFFQESPWPTLRDEVGFLDDTDIGTVWVADHYAFPPRPTAPVLEARRHFLRRRSPALRQMMPEGGLAPPSRSCRYRPGDARQDHCQPACGVHAVLAAASAWFVSWRAMIDRAEPAVTWLLASDEPAVQALTLTDVLGLPAQDREVRAARERFSEGPIARQLLSYAGEHVYAKWRGPFWRLTSLVELGVPSGWPEACEYLRTVLEWLRGMEARGYPPRIDAVPRAHAL